jgi:hypothetical protein
MQDGSCAVQLLREKDPHELMRKDHGGEGEDQIRTVTHSIRHAVCPSDHEGHLPNALISPRTQLLRERWAGEGFSPFIQDHHPLTGFQGSQDPLAFHALLITGLTFARFRQYHQLHGEHPSESTHVMLQPLGDPPALASSYQQQTHLHPRKLVRNSIGIRASTWPGICQISEQMKHVINRMFLALVVMACSLGVSAQDDVKEKVVQAMRTGNSKDLAVHFIPNIDLTVKETAEVYSRAQAEQIIRKFFNDNPPVDLVIEHSGVSKLGDKYFIGILRTSTGYFRVTFFLKKTETVYQVKQLRIENSKNDF